jgi:transposase InsO family protein
MTTTTQPRPRVKPARHVRAGQPTNGVRAVCLTIGTGETAKHYGYYLRSIAADFGSGFEVTKFTTEQTEGEDATYHVHIDQERGFHSCTCKGNTFCGHCKHVSAILALVQSGKLTLPALKPIPAA